MNSQLTLKSEKDLLSVQPMSPSRYQNEQLAALTVYSIYWLRQWGLRPTVETITVLNHRLFPLRFAMNVFPEFPDANRTLRSLLQSGPKYRGWLSGSNQRGYAITPAGQVLIQELLRRIGYPQVGSTVLGKAIDAPRQPTARHHERPRDLDFKAEVEKLRSSKLFERWTSATLEDRDLIHVYSALGIFDHTPAAAKRRRLTDLKDSARKFGDSEIGQLLDDVERLFAGLFVSTVGTRQRRQRR